MCKLFSSNFASVYAGFAGFAQAWGVDNFWAGSGMRGSFAALEDDTEKRATATEEAGLSTAAAKCAAFGRDDTFVGERERPSG